MKQTKTFATIQEAYAWLQEMGIDIHNMNEGQSVRILNDAPDNYEVTIE